MRRLGYYVWGIAIGCVLTGVLMSSRARIMANRRAAQEAAARAEAGDGTKQVDGPRPPAGGSGASDAPGSRTPHSQPPVTPPER